MSISYEKLLKLLKERGLKNSDLVKKNNVIGQQTWKNIQNGGNINTHTLNALCKFLNCKVEDIIEYVPDED